jgi:hypothetical protein
VPGFSFLILPFRQTSAYLEEKFPIWLRGEKSFAPISETMHSTPIDARAHHAHNPLTSLKQGTTVEAQEIFHR